MKLDTEDAQVAMPTSSNAESTVDQTTMTRALKLMSNVQVNHGLLQLERPDLNSESPVLPVDLSTKSKRQQMETIDFPLLLG
jgi:hypothetical protein